MWGAQQVPQTNVLPEVDLVITHGGNNTTTESFHFGKPMVLLPLFWDQYDNAQRVHETGYGVRLPTYAFDDDELIGAVDRLLADDALQTRMAANAAVIRSRDGTQRAADLIERVALSSPNSGRAIRGNLRRMTDNNDFSITVAANGPYLVAGGLPLHRRRDVQSELGEPMTWTTTSTLQTKDRYALCRCGQSGAKPFCDGTHARDRLRGRRRRRGDLRRARRCRRR